MNLNNKWTKNYFLLNLTAYLFISYERIYICFKEINAKQNLIYGQSSYD